MIAPDTGFSLYRGLFLVCICACVRVFRTQPQFHRFCAPLSAIPPPSVCQNTRRPPAGVVGVIGPEADALRHRQQGIAVLSQSSDDAGQGLRGVEVCVAGEKDGPLAAPWR